MSGGDNHGIKYLRFSNFQLDIPAGGLPLFRIEHGPDIRNPGLKLNKPFQIKLPGIFYQIGVHVVVVGERLDVGVEGLVFADLAVEDGNGAGIRLEEGPLRVSQSWFRDSQQGILTANGVDSELVVDKSTFTRLGTCEYSGGCAHSIYAGDYGSVTVTRTRFEQGTGGHYLKSRAARIVVEDCSFDDANGNGTNYLIDLPNGGNGVIRGNWFVQGRDKENWSTMIAIGAEGARYSSDGLIIAENDARLAPGLTRNPSFVADWTGDALVIENNRLGPNISSFESR